jgi:hemoglobin
MSAVPSKDSLYSRLGGYDAIAAVVDDLLPRLRDDSLLRRFRMSPRSTDSNNRERQLAVDFIAAAAGGPTLYLGRDMKTSHKGMRIKPGRLRLVQETSGRRFGQIQGAGAGTQ